MNCSKCKLPFLKNEVGLEIHGVLLRDGRRTKASFCFDCWMDLWGVTPYLEEEKNEVINSSNE